MNDKERQIKDLRTMEAMQKNLLGPAGKFGVIAKYLGDKIYGQGGSNYGASYLDDPWAIEEEGPYEYNPTEIQNYEDYGDPHFVGWTFDGMGRGVHLEIRYIDADKELTVWFKGYMVFREVNGDLDCYTPRSEWEDIIERLYDVAFKKKLAREKVRHQEQKAEAKGKALAFLDKLRSKWGI